MNFSLVRWLRRNRAASPAWPAEHAERLVTNLRAVDTLYPDTEINPWTARWPELCVPGDPCRVLWNSEADRGEWHDCANHQPKGRHRIRPALYAVVTDLGGQDG